MGDCTLLRVASVSGCLWEHTTICARVHFLRHPNSWIPSCLSWELSYVHHNSAVARPRTREVHYQYKQFQPKYQTKRIDTLNMSMRNTASFSDMSCLRLPSPDSIIFEGQHVLNVMVNHDTCIFNAGEAGQELTVEKPSDLSRHRLQTWGCYIFRESCECVDNYR